MTDTRIRRGAPRGRSAASRGQWRIHTILIVAAVLMSVPFVWQILTAFKTSNEVASLPPTILPATPTLAGFETFFASVPFWAQFAVSAVSLVLRVAGQVLIAALAGYAFARLRFPGRNLIFALFLLMLMV